MEPQLDGAKGGGAMQHNIYEHYYSRDVRDSRVLVMGPFLPPIGGVSVHVSRVIASLKANNNTVYQIKTVADCRFWCIPYHILRFMWICFTYRPHIIHYHHSHKSHDMIEMIMVCFLKRLCKASWILIDHDCRHLYLRSKWYKKLYSLLLTSVDKLVPIGLPTHKSYRNTGVVVPAHVSVEGAFLPPYQNNERHIWSTYPKDLEFFLQNHDKIILANAFQLSHINGQDLYGIDLCIETFEAVHKKYPHVGFVIALAQIGDHTYFERLNSALRAKNLHQHWYMLTGNRELWPLFKRAHVFVRPTLSDGASVSIQEALFFGVPVVASDVCERPNKVILFKNRDIFDFTEKVMCALERSSTNPGIKGGP